MVVILRSVSGSVAVCPELCGDCYIAAAVDVFMKNTSEWGNFLKDNQ